MPDLSRIRLHELPPFHALGDIAKEFKVDFTLFGGAAGRAAMYLAYREGYDFDLFDLTPFTSDIDLQHSGDKKKNLAIRLAIDERVQFASWCRWALLDRETAQKAAENRALSTRVPLRSISFSTAAPPDLPDDALHDLNRRHVSFVRNPRYLSTGLAREGRDLEVFGLLMSLNVLADVLEISGEEPSGYDLAGALHWLRHPETQEQLGRASDTAGLAARLWHLLAPQLARMGPNTHIAREIIGAISRLNVMRRFNIDIDAIREDRTPLTVSKMTDDGVFRVPELSPDVLVGPEAVHAVERIFKELGLPDGPRIDPAFELVAVLPDITVTAGKREKDDFRDEYFSGPAEDFLQVAWKPDAKTRSRSSAGGLTASIVPRVHSPSALSPNPMAVGGVFQSGRSWVRIDLSETTEQGTTAKDLPSSLLILRARHG